MVVVNNGFKKVVRHNGHTLVADQHPNQRVMEGQYVPFVCKVCKSKTSAFYHRAQNGIIHWSGWVETDHCGVFLAKQIMES